MERPKYVRSRTNFKVLGFPLYVPDPSDFPAAPSAVLNPPCMLGHPSDLRTIAVGFAFGWLCRSLVRSASFACKLGHRPSIQYSHRAYSCVSTEEQESVHHYLHDVPTNLGFRKLFASFVGFVPYHISIFDKLIYSTMKLILLLTAISSAAGFMPQGAVRQTTPLEMVSFGIGPDAATPDPTRTVDLNTKGVMIDPDYRFSKNLAAFSAGAMMMYPSKFFYIFLASSFIMSVGMSCL